MPMTFGTDFDVVISTTVKQAERLKVSYTDSCRESVFGVLYDESYHITEGYNITALSGKMAIRFNSVRVGKMVEVGDVGRFDRVLTDLCTVYPNVAFKAYVEADPFSEKYTFWVVLTSTNAEIVPAWWWAVLLCRILLIHTSADPGTVFDTLNLPDLPRDQRWINRSKQWDDSRDQEDALDAWKIAKELDGLHMFNNVRGPADVLYARENDREW